MIPAAVKKFLLTQKEGHGCFCIALNQSHHIIKCFGNPQLVGISTPKFNMPVFEFLPILLTETFNSNFEIPFYNISEEHVCNIYFLKTKTVGYLILVDRSEVFQVTKKYQQFAHDDNISKNKFKRVAEQLAKAQQKLNKSNQEKATLIAMLSHELGTPLTSILGYSELLLNGATNHKSGLEIIHRNATYLQHLIENTLQFGRAEAGELQIQLENVSIPHLFTDLMSTLFPAAQNKKLKLQMYHSSKEPINIDLTKTKQILINLLNNAIKYTDSGSVELRFSQTKKHYVFSVIDTGIGISKNLQESIFSPWERIEESSETGSGIGLFLSRKLAHALGGKITLNYSSKEFGSVFQLILPFQANPSDTEEVSPSEFKHCINKSILVIDDDYDILILIEALLQTCGIQIYTAIDCPTAFETIKNNKIDIILTDYNLGTIKASSFIIELNKTYPNLPVLLMSAMPTNSLRESYIKLGFKDIISKPINKNNLYKTILTYIKDL